MFSSGKMCGAFIFQNLTTYVIIIKFYFKVLNVNVLCGEWFIDKIPKRFQQRKK